MLDSLLIPFSLPEMKKMKKELQHLGTGEFLLLLEKDKGETFTSMAANIGMDIFVKRRLLEMLDARIEELERNNGNDLPSM